MMSTVCCGLTNLTTAKFFCRREVSDRPLSRSDGKELSVQRYGSKDCTTQGHKKIQLQILTVNFQKIGFLCNSWPGVALGCIQTHMVAQGAMTEITCLGVLSSVPAQDQASGSCGQQQLEGNTPSTEYNLQ